MTNSIPSVLARPLDCSKNIGQSFQLCTPTPLLAFLVSSSPSHVTAFLLHTMLPPIGKPSSPTLASLWSIQSTSTELYNLANFVSTYPQWTFLLRMRKIYAPIMQMEKTRTNSERHPLAVGDICGIQTYTTFPPPNMSFSHSNSNTDKKNYQSHFHYSHKMVNEPLTAG
jgi:hypothetical protein